MDPRQNRSRDEIHELVWHETEWMADSFVCRECWAGWIEPDDPLPITWVRPYWRLDAYISLDALSPRPL